MNGARMSGRPPLITSTCGTAKVIACGVSAVAPASALPSSIAARRLHLPLMSAQAPSPGVLSSRSVLPVLTTKTPPPRYNGAANRAAAKANAKRAVRFMAIPKLKCGPGLKPAITATTAGNGRTEHRPRDRTRISGGARAAAWIRRRAGGNTRRAARPRWRRRSGFPPTPVPGMVRWMSARSIRLRFRPGPSAPSTKTERLGSREAYSDSPSRTTVAAIWNSKFFSGPSTSSPGAICAIATASAPPSATRYAAPDKLVAVSDETMHAVRTEIRRTAQHRADVVRIAHTIEPEQQRRLRRARNHLQQIGQRDRRFAAHVEAHAFVMLRAGELVEILIFDHAIAEFFLHAPGEHGFQIGEPRFEQIHLAQIVRTLGEHRQTRVHAVDAHLVGVALARRGLRRIHAGADVAHQ